MLRGVDIFDNAVRVTLRPKAATSFSTVLRRAAHHQGRPPIARRWKPRTSSDIGAQMVREVLEDQ